MTLQIHSVHFTADKKLMDRVQEKAQKLKTFHDKIIEVEVFLKLDNVVHQIKDKVAEIKVHIPKHTFFVKHESKTFEESFDLAYKALLTQMKSKKEKEEAEKAEGVLEISDAFAEEIED